MNSILRVPFPRSYWVVPGKFLAGAYPGSATLAEADIRLAALATAGVALCVNLMCPDERDIRGDEFRDYRETMQSAARTCSRECRCVRFPIVDGGVPHRKTMVQILNEIDSELAVRGVVYVHCWGGRGRTGTTVACWLVRHAVATPGEAVEHLHGLIAHAADLFHPTPENDEQRDFVRAWRAGH